MSINILLKKDDEDVNKMSIKELNKRIFDSCEFKNGNWYIQDYSFTKIDFNILNKALSILKNPQLYSKEEVLDALNLEITCCDICDGFQNSVFFHDVCNLHNNLVKNKIINRFSEKRNYPYIFKDIFNCKNEDSFEGNSLELYCYREYKRILNLDFDKLIEFIFMKFKHDDNGYLAFLQEDDTFICEDSDCENHN